MMKFFCTLPMLCRSLCTLQPSVFSGVPCHVLRYTCPGFFTKNGRNVVSFIRYFAEATAFKYGRECT